MNVLWTMRKDLEKHDHTKANTLHRFMIRGTPVMVIKFLPFGRRGILRSGDNLSVSHIEGNYDLDSVRV